MCFQATAKGANLGSTLQLQQFKMAAAQEFEQAQGKVIWTRVLTGAGCGNTMLASRLLLFCSFCCPFCPTTPEAIYSVSTNSGIHRLRSPTYGGLPPYIFPTVHHTYCKFTLTLRTLLNQELACA